MKKLFASLTALMICGASVSMAHTASAVKVTFDPTAADVKVGKIEVPEVKATVKLKDFNVKEIKKPAEWYFVPLPIDVEAKARGSKEASYIKELKLNIHAAFLVGKDETPTLVSKEITYAEIPVSGSDKLSKGSFNAGFFISPMNAQLICGKKPDTLQTRLAAIAVEATFDGANCNSSEKEPAIVLDNSKKDIFSGKWWTKNAENPLDIKLHSIAETPFAPYYATISPPTVPLYGSSASESSSSSTTSSSYTGDTDTSSATDYSADTPTTDTTEEATPKKSSKKKSKKKRK